MSITKPLEEEKPLARELKSRAKRLCRAKGWEYLQSLGAGATAAIYEISVGGQLRALKIYSPKFHKGKRGDVVRRRLELVLDNLRDHDCPHLVRIFDGGEADGTLYMLMQRAPGHCLGDVLKLVPPSQIREIVRQVAVAAHYLESRQLCHRDIKADNVVVSEDFKHAVLLDLGVLRWLDEESTAGTDQEGQLPFVATARYSSPEYMFRLVNPGPELWRGLTFYQLGGLLHDLIVKERLFEDVTRQANENRYLIAHAVAAKIPAISVDGTVPVDLVLLTQRALEKNLSRRLAMVDWPNFLDPNERTQNEIVLGLRPDQTPVHAPAKSPIPGWARELEITIDQELSTAGIHCRHRSETLSDRAAELELAWSPSTIPAGMQVAVKLVLRELDRNLSLSGTAELQSTAGEAALKTNETPVISLAIEHDEVLPPILLEHVRRAFVDLSANVVRMLLDSRNVEPSS